MSTARTTELTLSARANGVRRADQTRRIVPCADDDCCGVLHGSSRTGRMAAHDPRGFCTMLIAAGTAALNHYIERESDRYMRRTASRPLPSGALQPREALIFGVALSIAGAVDLYLVAGPLTAGLGIATCLSYLLAYTP